jgi:hypothetical protein
MTRSEMKRLTEEDRFARRYCCWANNHKGWSKAKKLNRRLARNKLRRKYQNDINNVIDIFEELKSDE